MVTPRPITIRFFRDMLNNINLPVQIDVNYGARAVVATAKSAEMTSNQINYLKYLLNVYLPANLASAVETNSLSKVRKWLSSKSLSVKLSDLSSSSISYTPW